MPWVLVDVALVLLALVVLALLTLRLWRRVKALGREVARASEVVAQATETLGEVQAERPAPTAPAVLEGPRSVRSGRRPPRR